MLTPIEKVLTLKSIDLLANVGPRHLLVLADVVREVEMWKGQVIYGPNDPADALYVVVEGKVQLESSGAAPVEIEPGQAFGTWSLIDDSERGQGAVCVTDGLLIALSRADFYDVAADDLTLLRELVRILARRLRALVEKRPDGGTEAFNVRGFVDDKSFPLGDEGRGAVPTRGDCGKA